MDITKLEWDQKYSVGVHIIDEQHKMMFETINLLIESLSEKMSKEKIEEIIERLVQYKKFHFATEERYFNEFDYPLAEDHKSKHKLFNEKLESLQANNNGDMISFGFALVDFLEDWLINHLMVEDQKYVECFRAHGLK